MQETNDDEIKDNGEQLLSVVANTPNPSFLVLDKEVLESLRIDGLNESNTEKESDTENAENKKSAESDA